MAERECLSKGALAVRLAHDLVMSTFPLSETEYEAPAGGFASAKTVDGAFWKDVDMNDPEAKKERLREMATLIGELALMIEIRP